MLKTTVEFLFFVNFSLSNSTCWLTITNLEDLFTQQPSLYLKSCSLMSFAKFLIHSTSLSLSLIESVNSSFRSWIRTFLKTRKQSINLNGCSSSRFGVSSGFPHGSHIGFLLFKGPYLEPKVGTVSEHNAVNNSLPLHCIRVEETSRFLRHNNKDFWQTTGG